MCQWYSHAAPIVPCACDAHAPRQAAASASQQDGPPHNASTETLRYKRAASFPSPGVIVTYVFLPIAMIGFNLRRKALFLAYFSLT